MSMLERGALRCVKTDDLPWRPSTFAVGVFVKDIATADGWEMQVVRFEPGARFPIHAHEGPEFVFILEGEYDRWPYGLQHRTGYSARIADDQLKGQLVARPTTYLLGQLDILPLYQFDTSCSAMAQGPTRLARGLAYGKYLNEQYGAQHTTVVVPACGHSARCMFTAEPALPLIFPKP